MNVISGRQIHQGIRAPLRRPFELGDFFVDGTGNGRVADIGVDLHQKLLTDDHRLRFGMVDIRRDDRPARGDLAAYKLDVNVFAQCHITHFRGYLTAACVVHLCDPLAGFRAQGHRLASLPLLGRRATAYSGAAIIFEACTTSFIGFRVTTCGNPLSAPRRKALFRNAARTHGSVDLQRFIRRAIWGISLRNCGYRDSDSVFNIFEPRQAVSWMLFGCLRTLSLIVSSKRGRQIYITIRQ